MVSCQQYYSVDITKSATLHRGGTSSGVGTSSMRDLTRGDICLYMIETVASTQSWAGSIQQQVSFVVGGIARGQLQGVTSYHRELLISV